MMNYMSPIMSPTARPDPSSGALADWLRSFPRVPGVATFGVMSSGDDAIPTEAQKASDEKVAR